MIIHFRITMWQFSRIFGQLDFRRSLEDLRHKTTTPTSLIIAPRSFAAIRHPALNSSCLSTRRAPRLGIGGVYCASFDCKRNRRYRREPRSGARIANTWNDAIFQRSELRYRRTSGSRRDRERFGSTGLCSTTSVQGGENAQTLRLFFVALARRYIAGFGSNTIAAVIRTGASLYSKPRCDSHG